MTRRNRNTKKTYRPLTRKDQPVSGKPAAETPGDLDALAQGLVRRGLCSPGIANASDR